MSRFSFEDILKLDESWESSQFNSVNNWIKAIRRRGNSRATKRGYFKCLSRFVKTTSLDPDSLVKLPKGKIQALIQDFCDGFASKGQLRSAHIFLGYLRSFFKYNGRKGLEVADYKWRAGRKAERVPTKTEAYLMATLTPNLRNKALILCGVQSGLRNATLRALNVGDVRTEVETSKVPVAVHVTNELKSRVPGAAKENVEHFSFFGPKACQALRDYLEERRRKTGMLGDDEPLFVAEDGLGNILDRNQRMTEDSLQRLVKRAARRAGIKEWKNVRFHSLRKTFRAIVDSGFSQGGQMPEDDKEFLMGHSLPDQKAPYHDASIETLAKRYMALNWAETPSEELLKGEVARLEQQQKTKEQLLLDRITGLETALREQKQSVTQFVKDMIEARAEELPLTSEEEIEVRKKGEKKKTATNGGLSTQRIVSEEELPPLLGQGWKVVTGLPSGRLVIQS